MMRHRCGDPGNHRELPLQRHAIGKTHNRALARVNFNGVGFTWEAQARLVTVARVTHGVAALTRRRHHRWVAVELVAHYGSRPDVDVESRSEGAAPGTIRSLKKRRSVLAALKQNPLPKTQAAYPNYYPARARVPLRQRARKPPSDRRLSKRIDLESNGAGRC